MSAEMDVDVVPPPAEGEAKAPVAESDDETEVQMEEDVAEAPAPAETPTQDAGDVNAATAEDGAAEASAADAEEKVEEQDEDVKGEADDGKKPLFDGPLEVTGKRQRKKVERIVASADPAPAKKELVIEPGPGKQIGDLDNVCYWLSLKKSEVFVPLHLAIFGTRGKNKDIKKNIRAFSGYPKSMSAEDKAKRVAGLEKRVHKELKEIATWLDVETSGTKADVIATIIKFLEKPKASGKKHPKEIKEKAKARKEKASGGKGKVLDEPVAPKSALMLYAIDNRVRVKSLCKADDKGALMKYLKDEYNGLSDSDRGKWIKKAEADAKRYAREMKAFEAQSRKSQSAPSRKRKAKAPSPDPEISDVSESEEDSDDDEPLVKKPKSGPTKSEIKAAVIKILEGADLQEMTKKKVRGEVATVFPGEDLSEFKEFITSCITDFVSNQS